jgi:hypothetical protein
MIFSLNSDYFLRQYYPVDLCNGCGLCFLSLTNKTSLSFNTILVFEYLCLNLLINCPVVIVTVGLPKYYSFLKIFATRYKCSRSVTQVALHTALQLLAAVCFLLSSCLEILLFCVLLVPPVFSCPPPNILCDEWQVLQNVCAPKWTAPLHLVHGTRYCSLDSTRTDCKLNTDSFSNSIRPKRDKGLNNCKIFQIKWNSSPDVRITAATENTVAPHWGRHVILWISLTSKMQQSIRQKAQWPRDVTCRPQAGIAFSSMGSKDSSHSCEPEQISDTDGEWQVPGRFCLESHLLGLQLHCYWVRFIRSKGGRDALVLVCPQRRQLWELPGPAACCWHFGLR